MEVNSQHITKFLAAYFVLLPIVFGLQSIDHSHRKYGNQQEEAIGIASSYDCSLCDLYESQTAIIYTSLYFGLKTVAYTFCSVEVENLISLVAHLNYLRGPPPTV